MLAIQKHALTFFGWSLVVVLALIGLLILVCIPHNLRIRRVRRAHKALPNEVTHQALRLIEEAAKDGPSVTFLRLDETQKCEANEVVLESHVGGVPYAEAGDTWPVGKPAKFLLQVRLDEPSLGDVWQDRLLTFFLVFDYEQIVRSHAMPSFDRYVPLEPSDVPGPPVSCFRLTHVRMPVESDGDKVPPSPSRLCQMVPAIPQLLNSYSNDCGGLLSQILRPNVYSYNLEDWQVAYIGGDPTLIQGPHDPSCDDCGKPMRFLFMFGEILPGMQLADGGVCCVYGCDDHPHRCKGFIDSG
jgi:hypothetical protein